MGEVRLAPLALAAAGGALAAALILHALRPRQREGGPAGQVKGQVRPDAQGRMAAGREKVKRVPLSEFPPTKNDLILRAARGEKTERVPVWMMRQAGRYLPEFRQVRTKSDFFSMCQTPELACEVTIQPLERFPQLDAVIVFSDILVVPQAMGLECQMITGRGPVFPQPLSSPSDLDRLNFSPDVEDTLGYVWDVVNLVRQRVNGRVPVIGFTGAPFTLMGYMIEGGGSRTWSKAKTWLLNHPEASHRLLQGVTDIIVEYLVGKVRYGAQLLQVFESNGGDMGPDLFYTYSFPYLCQIVDRVKAELARQGLPVVPMTVFARGVNFEGALEKLADTKYDVVGLDWCIEPHAARARVSPAKASVQGNLDPCCLFASKDEIYRRVEKMIQGFGTQRYIANLGHGMMPDHDPEHAGAFIRAVHEISSKMNGA